MAKGSSSLHRSFPEQGQDFTDQMKEPKANFTSENTEGVDSAPKWFDFTLTEEARCGYRRAKRKRCSTNEIL